MKTAEHFELMRVFSVLVNAMKYGNIIAATVIFIVFSIFIITHIFAMWNFEDIFGPLDTYPRTQQTAESSDKLWKFEVYHRKLEPLNPLADYEIVFRITDIEGNRVSEQRIWLVKRVGFRKMRDFQVRFEKDVIIINDFWVADKADLKFEMCPLLEECLNEVK